MPMTRELVEQALAKDRGAVRRLVDGLTPVIQARAARVLVRQGGAQARRDVRQDVADMTQDVFVALFADGGRVLRSWDPARGLSLANFVGLAAERHVIGRLRSARRNPWTEEPVANAVVELVSPQLPDSVALSRDFLLRLGGRLERELTALGLQLFRLLYVEERSVQEVCDETELSADAVYAWRSRLGRRLRAITQEMMSENDAAPRSPQRGSL